MNAQSTQAVGVDERSGDRYTHSGLVQYRYALGEMGLATWCSVGREGACIRVGRYLRPGRHVILSSELSGRIVWCRPTTDGLTYVAGLRVFREDPQSALALSALVEQAVRSGAVSEVN